VVGTGCGHAVVVNTCRHAMRLTGVDRLCAVVGGFHLSGPLLVRAADRSGVSRSAEAVGPEDVVVLTHCTGWEARVALAGGSCNAFVPNTVGTRLEL
jgi:7,8-dihydropterin-6-yl-methyl-4-(beta-D-ribofuranosyl)aminobenzene 5'-phosphate synthase